MAFKAAFIAHAPDADPDAEPEKHRCLIETPSLYKLFVRVVQAGQEVEVCQNLVKEEGIHTIIFCPGFTHKDIAKVVEAVGPKVGVFVGRGDGPSIRLSQAIRRWELHGKGEPPPSP